MQRALLFWALSLAILAAGAWFVCPFGACAPIAFDRAGLAVAHALRGGLLDGAMAGITWLGSLAVLLPLTALAALLVVRRGQRRAAGFLMLALLGAAALGHLAKLALSRPRPDLEKIGIIKDTAVAGVGIAMLAWVLVLGFEVEEMLRNLI